MRSLIEEAGPYHVTSAQDGQKGLELLLGGGWALALIDLNLPGLDGIEVIQKAKEAFPDLPIIAVTGSTNSMMIDGAFRAGAGYVLGKPVDRDELLKRIQAFVTVEGAGQAGRGSRSGERDRGGPPAAEFAPDAVTTKGPTTGHVPTVVAVGSRPGDVEMGCGGILFKHRAEGHQVVILNLAGGGDPHSDLAEAAGRASEILGAQLRSVGGEDRDEVDPGSATRLLRSVMTDRRPGMLYLPTTSATRSSSVEIGRIALASADAVSNVLAYQCPSATQDFRPQYFVDVGPFMARKTQMLLSYDRLGLPNVGSKLAEATARYWGRFMDPEHVEPLEVVRRGGAGRGGGT